jgi:hypothetical protein
MIPMLFNKPEWCQESRLDGEQSVKDTQPQCANIKQSGVKDRTNKYIYDCAL